MYYIFIYVYIYICTIYLYYCVNLYEIKVFGKIKIVVANEANSKD